MQASRYSGNRAAMLGESLLTRAENGLQLQKSCLCSPASALQQASSLQPLAVRWLFPTAVLSSSTRGFDSVQHGLRPRGCSGSQVQIMNSSLQWCPCQLLFCNCGGGYWTKITQQLLTVGGLSGSSIPHFPHKLQLLLFLSVLMWLPLIEWSVIVSE